MLIPRISETFEELEQAALFYDRLQFWDYPVAPLRPGNVLPKRSMGFFSLNIKVTKNAQAFILEIRTETKFLCADTEHMNNCLSEVCDAIKKKKLDFHIVFIVAYLLYDPSPHGHIKTKEVLLPENINPWLTTNCMI